MGRKGRRTAAEAKKLPPLSNADRGRLMTQTEASSKTVDSWWKGKLVKPVTRKALEQAAKRLRLMVPHLRTTAAREETPGKRESRRPPSGE